jgi:hypothetical protein
VDAPDAAQGDGDEEDGDIQDNWIDYGSSEQELLVAVDIQGIDEKKLEQAIIERTTVYVDRHIFLHRWCAKSPIADSLQVQDLPFITHQKHASFSHAGSTLEARDLPFITHTHTNKNTHPSTMQALRRAAHELWKQEEAAQPVEIFPPSDIRRAEGAALNILFQDPGTGSCVGEEHAQLARCSGECCRAPGASLSLGARVQDVMAGE